MGGSSGSVMIGGRVMPPFWFWVSIWQGLLPLVSSSLWVPPLPWDTTGEAEMCSLREGGRLQVSTIWLPCADSSAKEPAPVRESQTERAASRVLPR